MKKSVGLLAALALCVTVGGVYATWIYATDAVPTAYATMSVTLTGTSSGGQAGTLTIAGTNTGLKIDDPAGGEVHKAELAYDAAGYFTITFTPNSNAEVDIKDGVDLEWYVGIYDSTLNEGTGGPITASEWTYNAQPIFTTDTTIGTIAEDSYDTEVSVVGVSYVYKLPMTTVMNKIELNNNLYLTTMEAYSAFETALTGKMFHVHVKVADNQVSNA